MGGAGAAGDPLRHFGLREATDKRGMRISPQGGYSKRRGWARVCASPSGLEGCQQRTESH